MTNETEAEEGRRRKKRRMGYIELDPTMKETIERMILDTASLPTETRPEQIGIEFAEPENELRETLQAMDFSIFGAAAPAIEKRISRLLAYIEAPTIIDTFPHHDARNIWRHALFKQYKGYDYIVELQEVVRSNRLARSFITEVLAGILFMAEITGPDVIPEQFNQRALDIQARIRAKMLRRNISYPYRLKKRKDEVRPSYLVRPIRDSKGQPIFIDPYERLTPEGKKEVANEVEQLARDVILHIYAYAQEKK